MQIAHVIGARPNLMKFAPVWRALSSYDRVRQFVIHTGQHYDANMFGAFLSQLGVPAPDVDLGVGSGTHAQQTAEVMCRIEPVLVKHKPDWVLVYGDVNSTVAAALVCSKLRIPLAHVEAGLRSFDRSMPEEINRVVTDQLADLLFTPSEDGDINLLREGVAPEKIHRVGNAMIDSLVRLLPSADAHPVNGFPKRYALVTLHRPANVDNATVLTSLLTSLIEVNDQLKIVFPVHPRTRQRLSEFGFDVSRLYLMEPQPYLEFLSLQRRATAVITDSGGIQEETTYLGVPCLTLRENTERPVTVSMGTNVLVGHDGDKLRAQLSAIIDGRPRTGSIPPLWDGHAADRIATVLSNL